MQKQAEICLTHHKKYWQWKFHHKPSWLGIIVGGSRGWFLHDAIMWFMQTNDHHCPSNVSTIGLSDLWSVKAKSKSWPAFTKTKLQLELSIIPQEVYLYMSMYNWFTFWGWTLNNSTNYRQSQTDISHYILIQSLQPSVFHVNIWLLRSYFFVMVDLLVMEIAQVLSLAISMQSVIVM